MELPPPPQGGIACVLTDHEVVNGVEDLAQDEVEREGEQSLEVVPSANVNVSNHPNVAPSHDDELAEVKRQCDKLKEALALEKEQRQILKNNFISSSKGNFELRKEIKRL
jgi:hypothetical protein